MDKWDRKVKDVRKDVDSFFDFWNKVGLGGLIVLSLLVGAKVVLSGRGTLTGILIIVTGVYVFTTFNQMREARKRTYSRPVQRDIGYSEEHDAEVPGIRNYGSATAYDIEFLAALESDEKDDSIKMGEITKLESPTTLEPGEFEPVVEDMGKFEEKLIITSKLEGGQLSLYYAYSTPSVHRIPPDENELLAKDLEGLQEKYPQPTSFDAESLLARCFPEE